MPLLRAPSIELSKDNKYLNLCLRVKADFSSTGEKMQGSKSVSADMNTAGGKYSIVFCYGHRPSAFGPTIAFNEPEMTLYHDKILYDGGQV